MSTKRYALLRVIKEFHRTRVSAIATMGNASMQGVGTKMGTLLVFKDHPFEALTTRVIGVKILDGFGRALSCKHFVPTNGFQKPTFMQANCKILDFRELVPWLQFIYALSELLDRQTYSSFVRFAVGVNKCAR